jgi:hypothetical protein
MRSRAFALPLAGLLALGAAAGSAAAQTWTTVAKSRMWRGQESLEVKIEYDVGRFEVGRAPDHLLYRLEARYDTETFELTSNYLESSGRGTLAIDMEGHDAVGVEDIRDYDWEEGRLRVELPPALPTTLNMKLGAVEAALELGGLRLREVSLQVGASDAQVRFDLPNPGAAEFCAFEAGAARLAVEGLGNSGCRSITISGGVGQLALDFSGEWGYDATADINVGLGGIEIRVPREIGVRIKKSTFLMSFAASGFDKRDGGVWVTPNWDAAEHRLTLSIGGALGSIKVARR